MLADKKSYGLVTIDRQEATIGLLSGNRINVLKHFDSLVPSKHHQGGQSSVRFERLIEIAAHEFYKKVAEACTGAFLDRPELQGILIGGPGATKDFFVKEEYLHHELRKKVIDTFDTGYTDEYGLKELVENAKGSIQDIQLTKEKEHVQRLLREIRKADGGLSAYGEDEVRAAAESGAAEVLLLSEGLNKKRLTVECPSGHRYKVTVSADDSAGGLKCSECGSSVSVVESNDLVDDFFEIADSFSTTVQIITEDSEEGEMLLKAFGGIAAILRYRVA
jgi:peptide chain release factor subunit 1